jgi:hypothetical protein
MKAKELIEILKEYPENAMIMVEDPLSEEGECFTVAMAFKARIKDNKIVNRPCKETAGALETVILIVE